MSIKINGCEYQYGGFRIYKDGEILWSTNRGYIESVEIENKTEKRFMTNRIMGFNLKNEVKKANKLNLNRKDNFKIVERLEYSYPERQEVLYIHADEVNVELIGEIISLKTEDQTSYINAFKLDFKEGFTVEKWNARELPSGYIFQSEKEKRSYFTSGKKSFVRDYYTETKNEMFVTGDYITRTEYSDFRQNARNLENEFESMGVKISSYDLEKILKTYNIIKK